MNMTCPAPVAAVILDILRDGVLACRAAAWEREADRCAVEADHIHNLPGLLADYSPEKLKYYWDVERTSFAARCTPDELPQWEQHWNRLRPFVAKLNEPVATR